MGLLDQIPMGDGPTSAIEDRIETVWTPDAAQAWATRLLAEAGVPEARWDAELLLRYATGLDRVALLVHPSRALPERSVEIFRSWVHRRMKREPIAYILETREFWGLDFHVTPDVLIPRPETELLIETALRLWGDRITMDPEFRLRERAGVTDPAPSVGTDARRRRETARPRTILDLGTGSGCLAIALAREFPDAIVTAIDASTQALRVAAENARIHGVSNRIQWLSGDLWGPLQTGDGLRMVPFDLIVSNPPYVERATIPNLSPEVRDHEPAAALDGGADGMDYYRRILREAAQFVAPEGLLLLEVGMGQAAQIGQWLKEQPGMSLLEVCLDLAGIERVVVGRRVRD